MTVTQLWSRLPDALRRPIRWLGIRVISRNVATSHTLHRLRTATEAGAIVHVDIRGIDTPIRLRVGTADVEALIDTFLGRYHLPPPGVASGRMETILDLGANIGLTAAHFASRFPHARICAVEMVPEHADLARKNLALFGRCEVINAAVWPFDEQIHYVIEEGRETAAHLDPSGPRTVATVSIGELVTRIGTVDYLKMDLEGAERENLTNSTEWASQVRAIKVEVHPPYSITECVSNLDALGFRTTIDRRHHSCVIGTR